MHLKAVRTRQVRRADRDLLDARALEDLDDQSLSLMTHMAGSAFAPATPRNNASVTNNIFLLMILILLLIFSCRPAAYQDQEHDQEHEQEVAFAQDALEPNHACHPKASR